jgi:hypothetical protein
MEGRAVAGWLGLGSVKLRRLTAGGHLNLLAILYDDFRMAAIIRDVSDEGDEFAVKVREIADLVVVAGEEHGVKFTVAVRRTE